MAYSIYDTVTADSSAIASPGVAVSGTGTYYSIPMKVSQHGQLGFQLEWSGTPTGTFTLWFSNHDNPDRTTDTDWVQDTAWTPTNPAGSSGKVVYMIADIEVAWARVKYVNSGGSGIVKGTTGHGRI